MRYTLESIGMALDNHILNQKRWEDEISADVAMLNKKLIIGNGDLPLTEQVHGINIWIGGVNKLIWILVTALVGQLVVGVVAIIVLVFHSLGGG